MSANEFTSMSSSTIEHSLEQTHAVRTLNLLHGLEHTSAMNSTIEKHSCYGCSLRFVKKSIFDLHSAIVHGNSQLTVALVAVTDLKVNSTSCNLCGSIFALKSHLSKHITKVHKDEKLHKCLICSVRFGDKYGLKKHTQTVHGSEKFYQWQCSICDFNTPRKDRLKSHVEIVHEGTKLYNCLIFVT